MIAHRPVWQKFLAAVLVVAMIVGFSSIFLLRQDPSGQALPWETVVAKACASINEVTYFHFDESITRVVWYEDTKVFEDSAVVEGDLQVPDRMQWIFKDGQELLEKKCIIGDKTYSWNSKIGAWELTLLDEVNGQQVVMKYRWDSQIGEWELIDWYDGGYDLPMLSMFENVQPVKIVEMLKTFEDEDIEQLSDEVIDDINCLHYRMVLHFGLSLTNEIWIGEDDHLIRQQRITSSFEKKYDPLIDDYENILVPDGATITSTETYTTRFSDFNEPVEIEAPYEGIEPKEGELDSSEWDTIASYSTESIFSIWGSSSSDVFTVGWNGTILHYDGNSWSTMASYTTEMLNGLWGSTSSDVFTVGTNGTILHYDGNTWSIMASNTTEMLNGIWGNSSSDVFTVGTNGTILHYDGNIWSQMSSGTTDDFTNIWVSSSSDVFVVSNEGNILHYNGSSWSMMDTPDFTYFKGVWGTSPSDVFTIGYRSGESSVLHYDGTNWKKMNIEVSVLPNCVWGIDSSDIFVIGDEYINSSPGHSWIGTGIILHYEK